MSRPYAYYELTSSKELKAICEDYQKEHRKAWKHLDKLAKQHGIKDFAMRTDSLFTGTVQILGFRLKKEEVPPYIRLTKNGRYLTPKRGTSEGKKLCKELDEACKLFPTTKPIRGFFGFQEIWEPTGVICSMSFFISKERVLFGFPVFSKKELKALAPKKKSSYHVPKGLKEISPGAYLDATDGD
jgi:hypothetical protein